MQINHIALWVNDLKLMKDFYLRYFNGTSGAHYRNESKGLETCFIAFDSGARLELMKMAEHSTSVDTTKNLGYAHIAFSVGDNNNVDALTLRMRNNGVTIASTPRTTGDGYYESIAIDPEGNIIEITAG